MVKKKLLTVIALFIFNVSKAQTFLDLNDKFKITKLEYNFDESPLSTPYLIFKVEINNIKSYFLECGPEIETNFDFKPQNFLDLQAIPEFNINTNSLYLLTSSDEESDPKGIKINFISTLEFIDNEYKYSSWKFNLKKTSQESNIVFEEEIYNDCIPQDKFSKTFPPDESYYTKIFFNKDLGIIKEEHFTKSGKNVFQLKKVNEIPLLEWSQMNCEPIYSSKGGPKQKLHDVKKGETLYTISQIYGISVNELKIMNNLTSDGIQVGDYLIIVAESAEKEIPAWVGAGDYHLVQKGETLAYIALKYGYTEKRLKFMNGFRDNDIIYIGQKILINDCSNKNASLIETNPELFEEKNYEIKGRNKMESIENPLLKRGLPKNYDSSNNNYKVHKVAQGETVFSIAKKYGVSTDNLKKLNNLSSTDILKTGQIIRIE